MFLEVRRLQKRAKLRKKRAQNEDRNFEADFSDFWAILGGFWEHFGSILGGFCMQNLRRNLGRNLEAKNGAGGGDAEAGKDSFDCLIRPRDPARPRPQGPGGLSPQSGRHRPVLFLGRNFGTDFVWIFNGQWLHY